MIILTINEDHNATAALLKDGKVLYAASEERITRHKNDIGYPYKTIDEALKKTNIKPEEIDYVGYTCGIGNPADIKVKRITNFKIFDYIREMREYWYPILIQKKPSTFWQGIIREPRFQKPNGEYHDFSFLYTTPEEEWGELFQKERINVVVKQLGISAEKVVFLNHHTCHAYYAYYASEVDKKNTVAIVTADGWGDGENGTIWMAKDGVLKKVKGTALCNVARIYRYITLLLGMKPFEHEYKVMGLAPYAKDYITEPAYNIFKETLVVDGIDFKWNKEPSDMYFYFKEKLEGVRFDGIAGGLQKWMEEILVTWIGNILEHLKTDTLVYSGGLAMNVKANKAISEIPELKKFFVPPSGGDESTTIGAGYALSVKHGVTPEPIEHVYLGYTISEEEIEKLLEDHDISGTYKVIKEVSNETVANLLQKNKVIARCTGAMEFGARALGNRSILCNPSTIENIKLVNDKIKYRDFWMPFTPSILDYRANDYLVNPKNLEAVYMTIAFDSTDLGREHLKAAIHPQDETVRPHIVTKISNPDYYDLIESFQKLTGIGGLLNTSLNLHGEPIVRSAEDAWHVFTNSGIDALLLNKTLIIKQDKLTNPYEK